MRKHLLLTFAALSWAATGAMAADNAEKSANPATSSPTPQAESKGFDEDRDWTLDEARKMAHERVEREQAYAAKLDKMTKAEWDEHLKRRHAFLDKWKKMTPDEKTALRQKEREKREEKEAAELNQPSNKK